MKKEKDEGRNKEGFDALSNEDDYNPVQQTGIHLVHTGDHNQGAELHLLAPVQVAKREFLSDRRARHRGSGGQEWGSVLADLHIIHVGQIKDSLQLHQEGPFVEGPQPLTETFQMASLNLLEIGVDGLQVAPVLKIELHRRAEEGDQRTEQNDVEDKTAPDAAPPGDGGGFCRPVLRGHGWLGFP